MNRVNCSQISENGNILWKCLQKRIGMSVVSIFLSDYNLATGKLTKKYGLPADIKFCRKCVISNQRPNSAVEYQHTAESEKKTIGFDSQNVCDACRVAEAKALGDKLAREREGVDRIM